MGAVARPITCTCGTCKKCLDRTKKRLEYQAMTPEQRRAWRARKDPLKRYATNRVARKRHIERHPEKAEARKLLQRALRSGRIARLPCEVCGAVHGVPRVDGAPTRVEAHHDDYRKPLEVRWLCTEHHRPPWVVDRG